jgi:hypothetical protein
VSETLSETLSETGLDSVTESQDDGVIYEESWKILVAPAGPGSGRRVAASASVGATGSLSAGAASHWHGATPQRSGLRPRRPGRPASEFKFKFIAALQPEVSVLEVAREAPGLRVRVVTDGHGGTQALASPGLAGWPGAARPVAAAAAGPQSSALDPPLS